MCLSAVSSNISTSSKERPASQGPAVTGLFKPRAVPRRTSAARDLTALISGASLPVAMQGLQRPARTKPLGGHVCEAVMVQAGAAKHLWALDFDGVVCDSVGESSLSAWKAASKVWPELMLSEKAEQAKEEVMASMRVVRPVVETGYENIVQVRCLLEGVTAEEMLAGWKEMLPECMQRWGLQRAELVELFGATRDDWISSDLQSWLAPNRIYSGVAAPIAEAMPREEVYIVTTKQARFTQLILQDMAGISFPGERIFSQTVSGQPKSGVLQMLQQRHPGLQYHFVEDKMGTLQKVCKLPELQDWKLYLVDWGYNTAEEQRHAEANPRIEVIDAPRFQELLGSR